MSRTDTGRARAALGAGLAVAVLSAVVAGCCGSGPSHKCDFTPPDGVKDGGGADGPIACGQEVCTDMQLCCVTKVPLSAMCIAQDPALFMRLGCEKPEDVSCFKPTDCPQSFICCLQTSEPQAVTCAPPQLCKTDDGMHLLICSTDADCPNQTAGSCRFLASLSDGTTLNACF